MELKEKTVIIEFLSKETLEFQRKYVDRSFLHWLEKNGFPFHGKIIHGLNSLGYIECEIENGYRFAFHKNRDYGQVIIDGVHNGLSYALTH